VRLPHASLPGDRCGSRLGLAGPHQPCVQATRPRVGRPLRGGGPRIAPGPHATRPPGVGDPGGLGREDGARRHLPVGARGGGEILWAAASSGNPAIAGTWLHQSRERPGEAAGHWSPGGLVRGGGRAPFPVRRPIRYRVCGSVRHPAVGLRWSSGAGGARSRFGTGRYERCRRPSIQPMSIPRARLTTQRRIARIRSTRRHLGQSTYATGRQ
jgi:hypothetical protein